MRDRPVHRLTHGLGGWTRGLGGAIAVVLALVLVLATRAVAAEPAPATDWATGLVTATGIGLADRKAPNPAVARGPARRKAEDAAKQALAQALPALPLAAGGTLADKLGDAAIRTRVDDAVARAITLAAEPETDGAWKVTMAVPIEAIRQALTGPRELPAPPGDAAPAVIVVDGVSAPPAVGYTVAGRPAATLWVKAVPPWARTAPRIKAISAKAGAIELPATKGPASGATEATLFVIVTK